MDYRKMERLLETFSNQQSDYLQLEPILVDVSKTGVVRFRWELIQPLIRYKLKSVLDEAYSGVKNIPDDDKDLSRQLLERFDRFKEPPFTIQRLCELLVEPKRWYKRRSPLLRGLEKSLLVVSTVEPDLSWMSKEQLVTSDEGKERLMLQQQELTCAENMITNDNTQSDSAFTSVSNKRPMVELSEADSTVTNGFDDIDLQRQHDRSPPTKKHCTDTNEDDSHPSDTASSTTSSPHEALRED